MRKAMIFLHYSKYQHNAFYVSPTVGRSRIRVSFEEFHGYQLLDLRVSRHELRPNIYPLELAS